MSDDLDIKCPVCPMCGTPPTFFLPGWIQAMCPNEDCNVFLWEWGKSAAENLADVGTVEFLTDEEKGV
jgi:hypothetical protein